MKRILLVIVLVMACFLAVGCGCSKKEEKKEWKTDLTSSRATEEDLEIFTEATKDSSKKYEAVALLGTQVVAGTNYMFLAIEDNAEYKIVTVYKNLEGSISVTSVADFDYTKFVNKNIDFNSEKVTGGWTVVVPAKPYALEEKAEKAFEKATETVMGVDYLPIATVGHYDEDGIKYAILCYGRLVTPGAETGLFLLTVYDKTEATAEELTSIAYIDIAQFNK